MEIKKSLKKFDIKISKIASDFGISRPTLDNYIDLFEAGKTIPNDIFQEVFTFLFSKEIRGSVEFAQKYDYVKRIMLQETKKLTKKEKEVEIKKVKIQNIISIIGEESTPLGMINFINLFLDNWKNELVKAIFMYFNYTNGFYNIEVNNLSEEEKIIYSNLAKIFSLYLNKSLVFDEEHFDALIEKNKRMVKEEDSNDINEQIINYIKTNISESEKIDFELLEKAINAKGK